MEHLNIEKIHPIAEDRYVSVPSDSWKELCITVNKLIDIVNSLSPQVLENTTDISKIAKILGDVYENLE